MAAGSAPLGRGVAAHGPGRLARPRLLGSRPRRVAALLCGALLGAGGVVGAGGAPVLSPQLDTEIVELHASFEETWLRINDYAEQLRAVGAWPSAGVGLGAAPLPGGAGAGALAGGAAGDGRPAQQAAAVPAELVRRLQDLQAEFKTVQQQALDIGRASPSNDELAQHPQLNDYLQNIRSFSPKLQDAAKDLEKAVKRATGKKPKKAKPKTSDLQSVPGFDIPRSREEVRAELARDARPFRSKAMDAISRFREGQLSMADKQADLQRTMAGPDWPTEDWPLTTQDAKLVGAAEVALQEELARLNGLIEPLGGLGAVHEAGDEGTLEQFGVLCRMMSGYEELVERHIATAKRASRGRQQPKKKKVKTGAAPGAAADAAQASVDSGSLRDRLLSFGAPLPSAQPSGRQPFDWLREGGPGVSPPVGGGPLMGSLPPDGGGAAGGGGGSFASRWGNVKGAVPLGAPPAARADGSPLVMDSFGHAAGAAGSAAGGRQQPTPPPPSSKWSAAEPVYSQEL